MKSEYLFVVLDYLGKAWMIRDQDREPVGLTGLLVDGWRPLRETTMPGALGEQGYVLILLERDTRDDPAFGFAKAF